MVDLLLRVRVREAEGGGCRRLVLLLRGLGGEGRVIIGMRFEFVEVRGGGIK